MADEQPVPPAPNNDAWQFRPTDEDDPSPQSSGQSGPADNDLQPITWTASEFVAHHKSPGWYLLLACAACALALLIWFLTGDKISAGVVLVGAIALGIFAARKPRQLEYRLDGYGLTIGPKEYGYERFRSFALMDDGAFASIAFLPLKRFAPLITIYFAPDDEEAIVDLLSECLPLEDRTHDIVDRFMNRIRF